MIQTLLMMGSGGQSQGGGSLLAFLPLILIIVVMYFFMIRPQAKRQKEHKEMLERLQKRDKVLTSGGIMGTIVGIKETEGTVLVKVADNVKMERTRTAIAQVIK